jgi:hypothetical protein
VDHIGTHAEELLVTLVVTDTGVTVFIVPIDEGAVSRDMAIIAYPCYSISFSY